MYNIGFLGGVVTILIGVVWLAIKISQDDKEKLSLPLAQFCWGSIYVGAFLLQAAPIPVEQAVKAFMILVGIVIAGIPVWIWTAERGAENFDHPLCGNNTHSHRLQYTLPTAMKGNAS